MLTGLDVERAEKPGEWDHGPFIITYTGKQFYYSNFMAVDIEIRDIAHSLSQLCRYTGHTNMFYSVAQHSMLVADKMPGTHEEKLVALLHDASEAYTNDLASPLKAFLQHSETFEHGDGRSSYCDLQDRITAAVYNRFGITEVPSKVRDYDSAAGLFEARGFMGLSKAKLEGYQFPMKFWELWEPWEPVQFASRNSDREPGFVEAEFLAKFEYLMEACGREELI